MKNLYLFSAKCMFLFFWNMCVVLSYREKAMQDVAAVSKHVDCLLQSVGKVRLSHVAAVSEHRSLSETLH